MPLHPQVQKLLENMARLDLKPIAQTPLAEARALMLETSRLLSPMESVHSIQDRKIPGPAGEIAVRIYRPSEEPLPVVMYFHGGGWVIGSMDSHDGYARTLANSANCVVVSVEYRLAPEHPFPAGVDDAFAATKWASENQKSIGGKDGPIGVAGDSAGGNLAAVVCLMARDQAGPHIGCQVLIYPITDCDLETQSYRDFAQNYFLTRETMRWFWDQYCPDLSERTNPCVSPLRAESLADLPPALVLTAEYDPLRDEAKHYAKKLQSAGVETKYICYPGMIHGFTRRFQLLDEARQAMQETATLIQSHL